MTRTVTVLGATGSIGTQSLEVLACHTERFRVHALVARADWRTLARLCLEHRPDRAILHEPEAARELRNHLRDAGSETEVLTGADAIAEAATEADISIAGIVGAAGLEPTLAAVRAGRRVLLANKEALVVTGRLFMDAVRRHGAQLIPVDSEHSAIFQCLPPGPDPLAGVRRLVLTASGGPFRELDAAALRKVTPEQAVRHPNWDMGPKISVDSSTLMNKGLELVEACWLFGVAPGRVEVVVHPQSLVHSMVEYEDASVLAQMGTPDMKAPIACGLAWPERIDGGAERLDFRRLGRLDFEAPDEARFPCLALARQAMEAGGTATAVLNAANEVAVEAFLAHHCGFMDIPALVEQALASVPAPECETVEEVLAVDEAARAHVRARLRGEGAPC